ncbi:MAG: hypothetical protein ACQEUG_15725 [Pseudomonadota bacterium]
MQKEFKLDALTVLFAASLFSGIALAYTPPQDAAREVLEQPSRDAKCQAFFDYWMDYAAIEDYDGMEELISAIDRQHSSLVDYCDDRSESYLSKHR